MNELEAKYGWRYVPTYTTRPLRVKEKGKMFTNAVDFQKMEQAGAFLCINHLFGNAYGTPLMEIEYAINNKDLWMMDFPITRRQAVFGKYKHIGIVVLPMSIEQLEKQISASGRINRLTEIINDYYQNYYGYESNVYEDTTWIVINHPEKLSEVAASIVNRVKV